MPLAMNLQLPILSNIMEYCTVYAFAKHAKIDIDHQMRESGDNVLPFHLIGI